VLTFLINQTPVAQIIDNVDEVLNKLFTNIYLVLILVTQVFTFAFVGHITQSILFYRIIKYINNRGEKTVLVTVPLHNSSTNYNYSILCSY